MWRRAHAGGAGRGGPGEARRSRTGRESWRRGRIQSLSLPPVFLVRGSFHVGNPLSHPLSAGAARSARVRGVPRRMRGAPRTGVRARHGAARPRYRARGRADPTGRDARRHVAARRPQGHRAGLPGDAPWRSAADSAGCGRGPAAAGQAPALGRPRDPRSQRAGDDPGRVAPRAALERVRDRVTASGQTSRRRARIRAPQGARPPCRARPLRDRRVEPGDASSSGEDGVTARAQPRP